VRFYVHGFYSLMRLGIVDEIEKVKRGIEELKGEIAVEKKEKLCKEEVDNLSKTVNQYPSREETQK